MTIITQFQGPYRFLSNFYPCVKPVHLPDDPNPYPTAEHAYQAAKTLLVSARYKISHISHPGEAKREGRRNKIRGDWDAVKLSVMECLLRQKFAQEPLRSALIKTGSAELQEGNYWGDTFWGICGGKGTNHLGRLLMQIRQELKEKAQC